MKIIFPMPHLLHYFNLTLNKVNDTPGVEVIVIIPKKQDLMAAGGGVNQTKENIRFKVIELDEFNFYSYNTFKGMLKVLRDEKPDIIVADETYMYPFTFGILTRITMKMLGINLVMQSIPYLTPLYKDSFKRLSKEPNRIDKLPGFIRYVVVNFGIESFLRRVRAYFKKIIFNRPDAHLNYVDDAYSIYGSYGVQKDKIFIADNSTDTDILLKNEKEVENLPDILPASNFRILHVGRLTKWKRVDLLIYCIAKLKDKFQNIELVIIGEGPEYGYLQNLAKKLEVSERTRFIGGVYNGKDLARYYKASSLYVLAGVGGLSINEAMFYKLPVICSVCDGTEKKLVRDGYNGKIFEEGNGDDLAKKISLILADENLKNKMCKHSREIIDNEINIHTVLARWFDAFDFVVKDKV